MYPHSLLLTQHHSSILPNARLYVRLINGDQDLSSSLSIATSSRLPCVLLVYGKKKKTPLSVELVGDGDDDEELYECSKPVGWRSATDRPMPLLLQLVTTAKAKEGNKRRLVGKYPCWCTPSFLPSWRQCVITACWLRYYSRPCSQLQYYSGGLDDVR